MLPLLLLSPLGCDRLERGCLHRDLDDWCWHEEAEEGPVPPESGERCEMPTFEPSDLSYRCGDLDVTARSGGYTGYVLYFKHGTGELVAVKYWTDVDRYCDGLSYWHGRRVLDCVPDCTYDEGDTGLPPCE